MPYKCDYMSEYKQAIQDVKDIFHGPKYGDITRFIFKRLMNENLCMCTKVDREHGCCYGDFPNGCASCPFMTKMTVDEAFKLVYSLTNTYFGNQLRIKKANNVSEIYDEESAGYTRRASYLRFDTIYEKIRVAFRDALCNAYGITFDEVKWIDNRLDRLIGFTGELFPGFLFLEASIDLFEELKIEEQE